MTVRILEGDCRELLKTLPEELVHCVVTSPPYWNLRDYGVAGQIGLEISPDEFLAELVVVFREVRRVLRKDGTAWVNMGDSYAGSWGAQGRQGPTGVMADRAVSRVREKSAISAAQIAAHPRRASGTGSLTRTPGLKNKDMIGMPWRLAFALQADGWYLRQDIVWAKPNPMPESTRDRCTKAHEYIFLLSKSERYYFDAASISEECSPNTNERYAAAKGKEFGMSNWARGAGPHDPVSRSREPGEGRNARPRKTAASGSGVKNNDSFDKAMAKMPERRNKRSVWTVPTHGFSEAHFATFPPALIEPCILAGCPEGGTVLDPFGGAGTTGLVADRHRRHAILLELNPEYAAMARRRIHGDAPLFAEVTA